MAHYDETQRRLRETDQLTMTLLTISQDGSRTDDERAIAQAAFNRIEALELRLFDLKNADETTRDELMLLNWLLADDGQYGECEGRTLDKLMARGYVEWKRQDSRGKYYGWVGLTTDGMLHLAEQRKTCPHPYSRTNASGIVACGVCGKQS